jgi:flagellar biosynthesis protein FlhF
MFIRKFYGNSMKGLLQRAKAELGEEVVILCQKSLEGGGIELTAAVEPHRRSRPSEQRVLEEEIHEIKRMLFSLVEAHEVKRLGKAALFLYRELKDKGLSEGGALRVVQDLAGGLSPEDLGNREVWQRELRKFLSARIETTQPLTEGRLCIVLLGRTGVGKTTTLAKLASRERFLRNRSVAAVSLDAVKVGCSEELQRIGRLLNIPVGVAYEKSQIPKVLEIGEQVDTLFVDTPGKGLNEKGMRERVFDVMSSYPHTQFHLLLSPQYRREVLLEDLEEYGPLSLKSLIVTKLDESRRVGSLMDAVLSHPIPLSWMTTGQEIPHDILPANKGMLLDMMMEA